ncbi:MAG: trypsin-like serine protease [Rhodobacteraceae bacterium]|nr:trypsin-like serine protease [Paracoccaceae bacterium]
MRRTLIALALSLAAAAAGAKDSPLRALATGDDGRGWMAVGRLDIGGRGFCTGTLIAPDLVLTAAHCVHDRVTGALLPAAGMTFQAGLRSGRAEAHRTVRRAVVHPDYRPAAARDLDRVASDLALLELDQPIRLPSVRPFGLGREPRRGAAVGVVSYGEDREETPALQEECRVLGHQAGVLVLSCAVAFGSSGAPVFATEDGEARIVSVVSAKAEMGARPVALGVALGDEVLRLRRLLAAGPAGRRALPQIAAGATGAPAGARFVRP